MDYETCNVLCFDFDSYNFKVTTEDKVLTADIERGMPSNHEIRFEKQSEQQPGTVPGDVIFKLKQVPHHLFR